MLEDKKVVLVFLLLIVALSFALKFEALNRYEVPPSPDYGNYLTQINIVHGNDVSGFGLRYPPLYFVMLSPFMGLDIFAVLKIAAALVFSLVAFPFFFVTKKFFNSNSIALVCTWLFVFFEGFSEMIAWGGNPNFLGISFMLLAIFFLIGAFKEPSKKNLLLTGFFLSLVVGTHFLVAAFTFSALLLFALLSLVFDRGSFGRVGKVLLVSGGLAAVFSVPYVGVYWTFFDTASGGLVEFNFLQQLNALSSGFVWMFRGTLVFFALMTVLGVFALAKQIKHDKTKSLLLCSLLLTPLLLALTTQDLSRWLYFLVLPVFISFGLALNSLVKASKTKKSLLFLLTICLTVAVVAETTVASINRLDTAINYYQSIDAEELQALNWIKTNTPTNATFATSGPNKIIGQDIAPGNSYAWWIEGFAERRCYHTGLTTWYTFEDERTQTQMLNQIFAGTNTIECGDFRVSENSPFALENPQVAITLEGQFQNLIFLSDSEQELIFSPAENNFVVWRESPIYAVNQTQELEYNTTYANATCTYNWTNLKVTKSVVVGVQASAVDVIFKVTPIDATLRQFTINLWPAYCSALSDYAVNGSTILLDQQLPCNFVAKTEISIVESNGEITNTSVLLHDPKYAIPVATYTLRPTEDSLSVHLRISVLNTPETGGQNVTVYSAYSLLKDLKIDYLFINKERTNEYNRFLNDSLHFSAVFENQKIAIFQVL
jgi:hypothetical protein